MYKLFRHVQKPVHIAPLITFRVFFGFIMLVSIIRFVANGWVHTQYIQPRFFFTFYGFGWVRPLGEVGMYTLFGLLALVAVMIMLGLFYRLAIIIFFLGFTYIELIDKTNYLNHYYFVSLVSFLLIWVPANRYFSLDVLIKPNLKRIKTPMWTIGIFKLQLGLVYSYAGIAKLNADWMLKALPLKIWLPPKSSLPIIGFLFKYNWVHYFFSWFGAIYDLTIPVFLLYKKTRGVAYAVVILFHILTWVLFPIGMFPFIMILATLIFFPTTFHIRLIEGIRSVLLYVGIHRNIELIQEKNPNGNLKYVLMYLLTIYFTFQVFFPWRFMLYPGKLFWTEQGYRFSWRVMLMEKAGYVIFHIKDPEKGKEGEVYASDFLTPLQEKMMSTQPDMILQFAHFLEKEFQKQGIKDPEIRAEAYVTLNGSGSRLFLDPTIDLTKVKESLKHKDWIMPFESQVTKKQ